MGFASKVKPGLIPWNGFKVSKCEVIHILLYDKRGNSFVSVTHRNLCVAQTNILQCKKNPKGMLFFIVHASTAHECIPEDRRKSRLLAWEQCFPAGSQPAMSFNSEITIYFTAEPYDLQPSTVAAQLQTFGTNNCQCQGSRLVLIHQNLNLGDNTDSS